MGIAELIVQLIRLIRKESEVISFYDLVLDATVDNEFKKKLLLFQNDHKRHIEIILDVLNNVDINTPGRVELMISDDKGEQHVKDTSGEFCGQNQAMGELIVKEKELNLLYKESLEEDVDSKSAEILDENLQDEQQHIRFFENFC